MMNKRIYTTATGKPAILWTVFLLVSSFFVACTDDFVSSIPLNPEDGEALTTLRVKTPQATFPTALTRSQGNAESLINELMVLFFKKSGDEYLFSYQVTGIKKSGLDGQQAEFAVKLITTDKDSKILVIANSNSIFNSYVPQYGQSEADIRQHLTQPFTSAGITGNIPMYGEINLPDGITSSSTSTLSVTVLRAVARVDVVKELIADTPDFILEEVYAFRANNAMQLIPNSLSNDSPSKVGAPSVADGSSFLTTPVRISGDGNGAESIIQLYLPEAEAAQTNEDKLRGVTTIVIGGRHEGIGNPISYYRVDFNPGVNGHPFGQILRNHRYTFKIKRVSSVGWNSPEDAANNLSNSMQVEVQTWEDFTSDMYFGEDQFGISARSVSLRYVRNRESRLDVESTLAYRIEWLDENGEPTGIATSNLNTPISNDHFDVTIVKNPTDAEHVSHLVFRTRNDNHLGNAIHTPLRITAGYWKADITVSQDNSAMYSNRIINLLSAAEIGDLGVDMADGGGASGMGMRKILDAQFAPSGIIRIGGFSYTRIPNTTGYVGTVTPTSLAVMRRIIGAQDIIYFPYNIRVSNDVADLLVDWLAASKHHVLIIGADSKSSNENLLSKLTEDGTWNFNNVANITSSYMRSSSVQGADDFFSGPFGSISENATFRKPDAIAGYNYTYPSDRVVSLISSDNPLYRNYMFFGVNKQERIVYNGESQFFIYPNISNNSGTVSSDMDKLMANTWAWMVEQVIYGDK